MWCPVQTFPIYNITRLYFTTHFNQGCREEGEGLQHSGRNPFRATENEIIHISSLHLSPSYPQVFKLPAGQSCTLLPTVYGGLILQCMQSTN